MRVDWPSLAQLPDLGVLVDLDGTLIPFAATPDEATIDDDAIALLRELAGKGVRVVIVTGRPHAMLHDLTARAPELPCFAEHGAWRWDPGPRIWIDVLPPTPELDDLDGSIRALTGATPGALVERKQCSVVIHHRLVPAEVRATLLPAVELAIDEWLESHPDFERLPGVEMIEVRHRLDHKGTAVTWLRRAVPGVRLVAIGDDHSDEDMFRSLREDDVGVLVGAERPTAASLWVAGPTEVRKLLRWIAHARVGALGSEDVPPETRPRGSERPTPRDRLLIISNRLPSAVAGRAREVGGLVSAIQPTLTRHGGVWLGWSGQEREPGLVVRPDPVDPMRVHFDYPPGWRAAYYAGFCNRGLWPLLHGFQARAHFDDDEWKCYRDANAAYARMAHEVASPTSTIWVHDYQLLLVADELRRRDHRGALGLFLHVPFPPRDDLETCPWARELLDGMLAFDLVGFHTRRWLDNFIACVKGTLDREVDGDRVRGARDTRLGVFPVGIEPHDFGSAADEVDAEDVAKLRASLGTRKLVIGVDRLDYSKGIPERLEAFGRLLELHPEWRGKASFVQISVPSRADVPEYAALRQRVENLVGRINGLYGEADWVPVRYLYRSYDQPVLAQLYRLAEVAMVTPLRDGMNLVAKEFVASQHDDDPGVLLLSRFAGASEQMRDAVLTNPYHRDGMAADLARALDMPLDERQRRHRALRAVVDGVTASAWAEQFIGALQTSDAPASGG
jgi:alpha,alpha-trehalose-phosphate synthase [UDP-forming]/trehalose-phosphatase